MSSMEFQFTAKVVLKMEHKKDSLSSSLKEVDFNLEVSKNLDNSMYLDEHDLPTKAGSQALTLALIQGLVGNIHASHKKGFRNDVEHLRFIISELERGFVEVVEVKTGRFGG